MLWNVYVQDPGNPKCKYVWHKTIYGLHNVCIQPEDLETSPVRAPPTEAPVFETDDEDLEESSGLDMDRTDDKGKRLFKQ